MKQCNFCHNADSVLLYKKEGFDIVQCTHCGLIYVDNPPNPPELAKYYEEEYYTGGNDKVFSNYIAEKKERVNYFRKQLKKIKKIIRAGELLDVGCAAGFFLEAAKNDFKVTGIEISDYSSTYAREALKHNVITGTLFNAKFPDNHFDIITMWDVIEHIDKPREYLEEIHRILKKGGVIVISTGDIDSMNAKIKQDKWELLAPPWHLYYFSRKVLVSKMEELGFTIIDVQTNGNLMGTKNKLFYIAAMFFAKLFKLGDVMTIYGHKK